MFKDSNVRTLAFKSFEKSKKFFHEIQTTRQIQQTLKKSPVLKVFTLTDPLLGVLKSGI